MMMVALLLRPWDVGLSSVLLIPRMLADDLYIYSRGMHCVENLQHALNFTHEILHDMGAAVAPKKSYLFASSKDARTYLENVVWPHVQSKINVILHTRDLGGQLNTTSKHKGTTINARIDNATATCKRIRFLNISIHDKERLIRGKILPMALYGIENAHPTEAKLHALQSAIVDVIGTNAARRCNTMIFQLATGGEDLDPYIQVTVRRFDTFRRMWHKHPAYQVMCRGILNFYSQNATPGVFNGEEELGKLGENYSACQPRIGTNGPIGYLLQAAHQIGGALDSSFIFHAPKENKIHIHSMPKNKLF